MNNYNNPFSEDLPSQPRTESIIRGAQAVPQKTVMVQRIDRRRYKQSLSSGQTGLAAEHDSLIDHGQAMPHRPQAQAQSRTTFVTAVSSSAYNSPPALDFDQVFRKGLEEGYHKGLAEARAEFGKQADEILQTVKQLSDERKKLLHMARPDVVEFGLRVAEMIVKNQIQLDDQAILNIVFDAMAKISDTTKVVVRVNKAHLEFLKSHIDQLESKLVGVKNILIQEDPGMELAGCIIETDFGYIDATVKTKIEFIKQALNNAIHEHRG